jgi:hypothetical protein
VFLILKRKIIPPLTSPPKINSQTKPYSLTTSNNKKSEYIFLRFITRINKRKAIDTHGKKRTSETKPPHMS